METGDKVRIIASKEELANYGIDVILLERQIYTVEMADEDTVWLIECGYGFKMSMLEVQ